MVHGDDLVAVASVESLVDTRAALETKYRLKVESLGEGTECQQEIRIFNQILRYTEDGIETEADYRHAEIVVRELGLEGAKASRVSGAKETKRRGDHTDEDAGEDVEERWIDQGGDDDEMEPAQATRYRAWPPA